jgi:hypothetical protein
MVGGRKVEHLMSNVEALDISLTPEQIQYLDGLKEFDLGFPYNSFVSHKFACEATCSRTKTIFRSSQGTAGTYPVTVTMHATIDPIPKPLSIQPVKDSNSVPKL